MAFVQATNNVTPLVKPIAEERVKHTLGTSDCTFDPDNGFKNLTSAQVKVYLTNTFTAENIAKANINRANAAVKRKDLVIPATITRMETTISSCNGKSFVVHLMLFGTDDTGAEMVIDHPSKMGFISHVDYGRQLLPDYIATVTKSIHEEDIYIKFNVDTIVDIF